VRVAGAGGNQSQTKTCPSGQHLTTLAGARPTLSPKHPRVARARRTASGQGGSLQGRRSGKEPAAVLFLSQFLARRLCVLGGSPARASPSTGTSQSQSPTSTTTRPQPTTRPALQPRPNPHDEHRPRRRPQRRASLTSSRVNQYSQCCLTLLGHPARRHQARLALEPRSAGDGRTASLETNAHPQVRAEVLIYALCPADHQPRAVTPGHRVESGVNEQFDTTTGFREERACPGSGARCNSYRQCGSCDSV